MELQFDGEVGKQVVFIKMLMLETQTKREFLGISKYSSLIGIKGFGTATVIKNLPRPLPMLKNTKVKSQKNAVSGFGFGHAACRKLPFPKLTV